MRAEVPKWLFGTHLADGEAVHGNIGARASELLQSMHHAPFFRRFLALPAPGLARRGALALALAPLDSATRATLTRLVAARLRRPSGFARRRLHLQSLIVMQPHDVLPNGEQDECDGCPNKTYWEGRLVSECRKEDYLLYGRPVVAASRAQEPRRADRMSSRLMAPPARLDPAATRAACLRPSTPVPLRGTYARDCKDRAHGGQVIGHMVDGSGRLVSGRS